MAAKHGREELLTVAVERAYSDRARSGSKERSSHPCDALSEAARCACMKVRPIVPSFSFPHIPWNGAPRWLSLRASREHCFIVRPLRARKPARGPV